MKIKVFILLSCLLCIDSCLMFEKHLVGSKNKEDCQNRIDHRQDKDSNDSSFIKIKRDSSLMYSLVEFDQSYNWARDSAYGLAGFTLKLYKDHKLILSIPSSEGLVSSNPETHHIVDGKLYTEHYRNGKTIISLDGELVLELAGKGVLKGIMEHNGSTYYLFQQEHGLCLTKGEEVIFAKSGAQIFGDLSEASYRPHGALYEDSSELTFCYWDKKKEEYYCVKDGVEQRLELKAGLGTIYDVKMMSGKALFAGSSYQTHSLEDTRVWKSRSSSMTSGFLSAGAALPAAAVIIHSDGRMEKICDKSGIIHLDGDNHYLISEEKGGVDIFSSANSQSLHFESALMMQAACFSANSGLMAAGISSTGGKGCFILTNNSVQEYKTNAYISCVEYRISLPIPEFESHPALP